MEKSYHNFKKWVNEEKHKYKIKQPSGLKELADNGVKTVKAQNLHDKLVIMQAINYKKQGYTNIKVKHINYLLGQPDKVGRYTPDLSAVINNRTTICDIETNDSIDDTDTVDKWRAFDRSGCNFHLIIPNKAFIGVKEIAKSNGITVDKYWSIKDY